MDGGQGHQGELTPGQQVLNSLPTSGPPRTYVMNSTNKHKVSRGKRLYTAFSVDYTSILTRIGHHSALPDK